jgi:hypothetical protein
MSPPKTPWTINALTACSGESAPIVSRSQTQTRVERHTRGDSGPVDPSISLFFKSHTLRTLLARLFPDASGRVKG